MLSGSRLITYKSFIKTHLNYDNAIYDQLYNNTFHQELKLIQYNATLAITGAIKDFNQEKRYQKLDLGRLCTC